MTSRTLRACCAAFLACLWLEAAVAKPPSARTVQGVVTRVTDGDSLWLAPPGQPDVEVRLRDIDAPEICQIWGAEARRALEELVLGQAVVLRITGRDAHGRTLGHVQIGDADVGRKLVEEGHAWSMRTRWDRGPLVKEERMAAALRRGLHGLPGAVMPRDFRQGHGPCVAGLASDRPRPAAPPPTPAARLPPTETSTLPAARWRCDGRTRCTQMTSCEEARFFLRNCPGVQMDGDGDRIPCESQWCRDDEPDGLRRRR